MADEKPTRDTSATEFELLYRGILDSALDCIITMDAKGRVVEFNPAAERTFGYSRAEAVGQELAELIIPARMREQHRRGLAHFLKTGEGPVIGHRIEIAGLRKDGSEILVELAITALKIDHEQVFTAYLRDITEHKFAEEQFRIAVEAAPSGMIMADDKGRIVLVNAHAEKIFGYTRDELIGQSVDLLVPERLRGEHPTLRRSYVHQPSARPMGAGRDLFALRKDGTEVPVEIGLSPIRTSRGVMVLSAIVDITERKRAEETLRESQQRLQATYERAPIGIVESSPDGKYIGVNEEFCRLLGYSREELLRSGIKEVTHKEDFSRDIELHRQLVAGEIPFYQIEKRYVRKDGAIVWAAMLRSIVRGAQGRPLYTIGAVLDITERVRNERRRLAQYTVASLLAGSWTLDEASSAILQTIASIGDWVLSALWVYDETIGRLRCRGFWQTGEATFEKFGEFSSSVQFTMGEGLPGRVWQSNEPAWIYDVTVDKNFPRALAAKQAGLHGGFAFPLFAGNAVNGVIELFSEHVAEPDPDLLQLIAALGSQIGMFIERRRIERELQREKENAEAANAAKDRFLATLSHELRTPLTPVLIWAGGTINQPGLSPDLHEGLKMVCRNVELEARLIDDLLDLTRLSRGKLQLQLSRADAHELVRHSIEIVRKDIEDRHLRLSVALDAPSHQVNVDPPRLQQVFWNLLRNACKFTPEHGAISVRSFNRRPDLITIEIRDTGVGVPHELLDKIFEAFEQVDRAREGLGLGLAISKAIVEMHGGRIRAQSEGPGKGSTFMIELPALEAPSTNIQAPEKLQAPTSK